MAEKEKKLLQSESLEKGQEKKQVLLRISTSLWNELASWSEDEFRSINGQMEYLLTEAVKERKKCRSKQT